MYGDERHDEGDGRIGPPQPEHRVRGEADQDRKREVSAENVLCAFARGRARLKLGADPLLGVAEHRHSNVLTIASEIPTQLAWALSTVISRWVAAIAMYGAKRKKLIATTFCACRSASGEVSRSPVKRQMITRLATPVIELSMPCR